jgi:uncharacterized membrane protein (DUF485 family)
MLHDPQVETGKDPAAGYKSRLGMRLFCIYSTFYVLFVVINLAQPTVMETEVVAGLNLAVVYGMALIVSALVLALWYDRACRREEVRLNQNNQVER